MCCCYCAGSLSLSLSLSLSCVAGLKLLIINSLLDTTFNLALILIIAATSPLVASVASILTIPASAVADYLAKGEYYHSMWAWVGIGLIGVGFVLMATEGHGDGDDHQGQTSTAPKVLNGRIRGNLQKQKVGKS